MADSVSVYTLGMGGVDVDTDPVLMKDEAVRQAQNAEHRAVAGRKGALGNRDGYARFITRPLDGAILGGIEMPVADTGGAPASGGGGNNTGSPVPGVTGDNLGPGLTTDTNINAGGSNPPGPGLGQDNLLFGGARLILIGLHDSSIGTTQEGYGWFIFPEDAGQTSLVSLTGTNGAVVGPPGHTTDIIRPGASDYYAHGQNPWTIANGVLFYGEAYIGAASTSDTTRGKAKLRRYDGKTDARVVTFPHNELLPGVNYETTVVNVIVKYGDGNTLYVALADRVPIAGGYTGYHGRVFEVSGLDARNYAVTEVFNSIYAGNDANGSNLISDATTNPYAPYAMEFFGGALWIGMWRGHTKLDLDVDPQVFKINVGTTAPLVPINPTVVADHTATAISDITVMKRFNGSLFFGTREAYNKTGGGATYVFPRVYKLDPDNTLGTSLDSDDGGTAGQDDLISALDVFQGNLYAAAWLGASTTIWKFDGTSWTAVLTVAGGVTSGPLNIGVDTTRGRMYAYGRKSASVNMIYVTTDGTSWTTQTTNFATGPSAHYNPMNFFYGVDQ